MIRTTLLILFAVIMSGCISSRKFKDTKAQYDSVVAKQLSLIDAQRDSIYDLQIHLAHARGGNEALLKTQDKLQNLIQKQEDELDAMLGNLNNTSSQLSMQLQDLRHNLLACESNYDTLLQKQANIINDFTAMGQRAASVVDSTLDGNIPDDTYTIAIAPGQMTLSVQEDILFHKRAISRTVETASFVLRAITDALQSDPLLKLRIVGHTDNQPSARRNTTNWDFSALRATHLAQELRETYYLSPNRLIAASQGEFMPLGSNATEEGRKRNRRIDFILFGNSDNLVRALGQLKSARE